MKTVAILGASADRSKFGNKAVRAFQRAGWHVYPVNPAGGEVEGLPCYPSLADVPGPAFHWALAEYLGVNVAEIKRLVLRTQMRMVQRPARPAGGAEAAGFGAPSPSAISLAALKPPL